MNTRVGIGIRPATDDSIKSHCMKQMTVAIGRLQGVAMSTVFGEAHLDQTIQKYYYQIETNTVKCWRVLMQCLPAWPKQRRS